MNITLDLHQPVELRAFAVFLTVVADAWGNTTDPAIGPEVEQTTAAIDEKAMGVSIGLVRKRGEPSPGHKRRTKAKIAEDERAEEAEMKAKMDPATQQLLAETQKGLAAISTGGERVAPDDEPAVEQQDVADEADETAKAGAELSHDDVRNAMGQYVTKFGMDAAQIDIPKVFQLALKDTAVTKVSLIPGDQASLKKAVDGVMEMLAKNPFSRDAVA